MKNLLELRKELEKNFLDKTVKIELKGSITYTLKIDNTKYLLNEVYLIFSNYKENQISICLDEIGEIEVKEQYIRIFFNYEQELEIYT